MNYELKKNNDNWYVIEGIYYSMGLSFRDMIDIHQLIEHEIKERKFYFNHER